MRKLVILFIFLYFICIPGSLYAEDFNIGREGEIIRPLDKTQISVLQAEITAVVQEQQTKFLCRTLLKNNGPGTEMFVGYPAEEINKSEHTSKTFHDFQTTIDGQQMPVMETNSAQEEEIPENPRYNKWFLWPLIMDTAKTKEIDNSFWTENTFDSVGNTLTGFVLKPIKYWNGNPQEVKVKYNFDKLEPYVLISASPANYAFEGDAVVFKYTYQVPDTDIKLSFNPDYEFLLATLPTKEVKAFWQAYWNGNYQKGLQMINDYEKNTGFTVTARQALSVQKGILLYQKDITAAKAIFELALKQNTKLSAPYYYLAEIYSQAKQSENLYKLYNIALNRRINPVVLRKIESYLTVKQKTILPQFVQINPGDASHFTAEILDRNSDIQNITMQVFTKQNGTKKFLSTKVMNIQGQAYRYYINENIKLPVYVDNVYCSLMVIDGSGAKIEKTLPITNRTNRLLTNTEKQTTFSSTALVAVLAATLLLIRFVFKKIVRKDNLEE